MRADSEHYDMDGYDQLGQPEYDEETDQPVGELDGIIQSISTGALLQHQVGAKGHKH
jgi:hypothetical protein